ncbi:MAG: ATP-binding cassette domain-containing protein [Eubacterium sp.]|nr:ATP-binding cassette domain-containing protein [Eubacterium sp.]
MIELRNIRKSFGDKVIIDGLCATIEDGTFTIIAGPSGCGKTTLLNMLGYLEKTDEGDILIDGTDIKAISQGEYFSEYVGFLFQNFALMENKTVKQNLEIIKKKNRSDIIMKQALDEVGLSDQMNTKVYKLSGGEQQRVALARLMMKKCKMILADEPTGSLDAENGRIVMDLLHKFADEGKIVIMVTHDTGLYEEADQVIELK